MRNINCKYSTLQLVGINNFDFIKSLFNVEDIRKFYVLREEHASDLDLFCNYLFSTNSEQYALNFIIYNLEGKEVGLITAEPVMNRNIGMPEWNVGYAIHPSYRRSGFASDALNTLSSFLLSNYAFPNVVLDISTDNEVSEKVAQKCGFEKINNGIALYDFKNPDVGIRFKWERKLSGKRSLYFNQAAQLFRTRSYKDSINIYKKALSEPYNEGSPYTDAQIYSNIGMAYSALKNYTDALYYLKKARNLGLTNNVIERELKWLKDTFGLY